MWPRLQKRMSISTMACITGLHQVDVGKILQFVGPLPFRSDDTRIDESNVEIKHANDYYESSYQQGGNSSL